MFLPDLLITELIYCTLDRILLISYISSVVLPFSNLRHQSRECEETGRLAKSEHLIFLCQATLLDAGGVEETLFTFKIVDSSRSVSVGYRWHFCLLTNKP